MEKKISVLILLFVIVFSATAQNFTLNFFGYGDSETIDSVFVTNLKSGNKIDLAGSEALELVPGAGLRFLANTENINVAIYPNPSDNFCNIEFALEKEGQTSISLYDIAGKTLIAWNGRLAKSVHVFQLQGLTSGMYNLIIKSESLIYSNRIVGTGDGNNSLSFSKINEYPAEEIQNTMLNKSKSTNTLPYLYGELLLLEATSSEGHKTVKTLILNEIAQEQPNRYIDFYFVDCIDADSYMYKIVEIGDYVWMAEDLKTTKYRDNSEIKNIKDTEEWVQLKEGAWCNYENESKEPILYNWYSASNTRQICPVGWHIPSDDEWMILEMEIGMSENHTMEVGWRGNDISWKLKETGEEFWLKNDEEKTNLTGFGARANGMRNFAGNFYYKNNNAVWWTATETNPEYAWSRGIQYDVHSIFREDGRKNMGFSLRCMKNYPPILETTSISNITENSAKSGGKILNLGGGEIIAVGLIWGTNPDVNIYHNLGFTESANMEDFSFSAEMTGLIDSTKYYMCAYATNDAGTGYGEVLSFVTLGDTKNTVVDIDGNVYDIVKIGDIRITGQNLKTTRLNDGTDLTYLTGDEDWEDWDDWDDNMYYMWSDGNPANKDTYGAIYDWNTVNSKKLCPTDWRVTTDNDWKQIELLLGMNEEEVDYMGVRGEGIGSMMVGNAGLWNDGELVNNENFGTSGINLVPSGGVFDDGFIGLGEFGAYWTTTSTGEDYFIARGVSFEETGVSRNEHEKLYGLSVRCIKGDVNVQAPDVKTLNIMNIGFESADVLVAFVDGENYVWEKGIVWSTMNNPSLYEYDGFNIAYDVISDTVLIEMLDLEQGLEYFVRAYARYSEDTIYGEQLSFTSLVRGEYIFDADGNVYETVKIGEEFWSISNSRTTKFNNNQTIPLQSGDWDAKSAISMAWYNDDEAQYSEEYGALYSWSAVHVEDNGGNNICPVGYHVATTQDWQNLIDTWGGENNAGKALKEFGFVHWIEGNTGTNISGFTALPGGLRTENATYEQMGETAIFWAFDQSAPKIVKMNALDSKAAIELGNSIAGYSVRCVKNSTPIEEPVIDNAYISNVLHNGFVVTVNIANDGGAFISDRGVIWSTNPNPNLENNEGSISEGTGDEQFICEVTGLDPRTDYYVMAYATNEVGTSYYSFEVIKTDFENCGTISDVKGNVYKTVTIGNQCWMRENLKTTAYTDNSSVTEIIDANEWTYNFEPALTWYNFDFNQYGNEYGALYNLRVSNFLETKGKSICPEGFHVPYRDEWLELFDFASGLGNVARILGAENSWDSVPATNQLGFAALPAGMRADTSFSGLRDYTFWQTCPNSETDYFAYTATLSHQGAEISENDNNSGISIRCLKNIEGTTVPSVSNVQVNEITDQTASIEISGISDGGYDLTHLGVMWSTNSNLDLENYDEYEIVYMEVGMEPYFIQIIGLNEETQYYYRWFAINALGVAYGNVENFTTEEFLGVFDGDGNLYNSVTIGNQAWLSENLKTTSFNDGTPIDVEDYVWYDNDYDTYGVIYGALYANSVFDLIYTGDRSICPNGWHIPNNDDWNELINFLIDLGPSYDTLDALKATDMWINDPGTDNFGFRALPAGKYDSYYDLFEDIGLMTTFWSSTATNDYSYGLVLFYSNYLTTLSMSDYFSIRCIKNPQGASLPSINYFETVEVSHEHMEFEINDINDGGYEIINFGVIVSSVNTAPTLSDNEFIESLYFSQEEFPPFFLSVFDLQENTTYYVRAFATNPIGVYYSEVKIISTEEFLGILDGDGNLYNSVAIGNQEWLAENLKTTSFNDGTPIPTSDFSWYDDDFDNYGTVYGGLYSSSAISPNYNGGQSVCPVGWHIPTNGDWNELINFVGGSGATLDALKSIDFWDENPGTDDYGFRALPAGAKDNMDILYMGVTYETQIWSSSIGEQWQSFGLKLSTLSEENELAEIAASYNSYSVRCTKNSANASVPILTIGTPVAISDWELELSATVSANDENYEVIYMGFIFSETPGVNIANALNILDVENAEYGDINTTHYELPSGATYYVRAYAINAIGIGYSEEIEFEYIAP